MPSPIATNPDDTLPTILGEVCLGGRLLVVSMDMGTAEQRRGAPERIDTWMHRHFPTSLFRRTYMIAAPPGMTVTATGYGRSDS
jgi:hypothetical protein